jgi:hypothetical protein
MPPFKIIFITDFVHPCVEVLFSSRREEKIPLLYKWSSSLLYYCPFIVGKVESDPKYGGKQIWKCKEWLRGIHI